MKREKTFYSLYPYEERLRIERMADSLGDRFVGSHFEQKWYSEYWIHANNDAFLEHLKEFDDSLDKIFELLHQQLEYYKERTPIEPRFGLVEDTVVIVKRWLRHTQYICKKACKEFKDEPWVEVYAEAIKWCDWKIQQIDTRHGLNVSSQVQPPVTISPPFAPTPEASVLHTLHPSGNLTVSAITSADQQQSTLSGEQTLDQPARALYWFYLHDTGSRPDFSNHPNGKIQAIKELVGDKSSWKNFQLEYNKLVKYDNRTCRASIKKIEEILPLLEEFPKAHLKAKDELKAAKNK